MPVNSTRVDYDLVLPQWQRLRDTYGGRDMVLKAGNKYVPDLPGLNLDQLATNTNKGYRERGNFYSAVKRTVYGLAGMLFQKSAEVQIPDTFKSLLQDVTLTNITFEMFVLDAGQEAVLMGRYGVLVDMPPILATDSRPYLSSYKAEDIINWRTRLEGGDQVLTLLVLREYVDEVDVKDPFVNVCVCQYRVCRLAGGVYIQDIYQEKKDPMSGKKEWVISQTITPMRRGQTLDFIPFVFIGSEHATSEIDEPPLIDLADLCLSYWRNSVDYEYGLHLTALPTPWVSGSKPSTPGSESAMKIGPSVVWELDVNGSAGMLEFTGNGLKALMDSMIEKKKQMAGIGSRMLEDIPSVDETATAVQLRRGGEHASLRTVANAMEQALTMILQTMVWWLSTETEPSEVQVAVELNKDYFALKIQAPEVTAALAALQAGKMSFETWWNLLTTGGWGREGIDANAEMEDIAADKAKEPDPVLQPVPTPTPTPTPEPIAKAA